MRFCFLAFVSFLAFCPYAFAEESVGAAPVSSNQVEITADKTLEWYRDQGMYVARGNARAARADLVVTADILTAHQRDKAAGGKGSQALKDGDSSAGDIDKMTAEGNVVIVRANARITGDRAVDDVDGHVIVVTGDNLRYSSGDQVVTAKESLEYWDGKKMAVARGDAVAMKGDRRVSGDVLTAEFRDQPNGDSQLHKVTAVGHVTVITKNDVTRGDKGVYDAARDIAIISGHVRITRADGTELTGDVGEADFVSNQSRLMNDGTGRVRALLPSKASSGKQGNKVSRGVSK